MKQLHFLKLKVLTPNGWEAYFPPMPVTMSGHCMVRIDESTVMVIAGSQAGVYTNRWVLPSK
jgi:hypothetical protein